MVMKRILDQALWDGLVASYREELWEPMGGAAGTINVYCTNVYQSSDTVELIESGAFTGRPQQNAA